MNTTKAESGLTLSTTKVSVFICQDFIDLYGEDDALAEAESILNSYLKCRRMEA